MRVRVVLQGFKIIIFRQCTITTTFITSARARKLLKIIFLKIS